jgi:C-terminal binding-module, SLH-like, of glucodextranase
VNRSAAGVKTDPLQPPLVDVIVPAGPSQESLLKDYDIQAKRPVRLEGVVPAARAAFAARRTR